MWMFCVFVSAVISVVSAAAPPKVAVAPEPKKPGMDVVYGRAGGQDLLLDVFLPETTSGTAASSTAPRPAIMFVHGGGWQGGNKKDYHADARWFAEQGYVGFCVGYRLVRGTANQWPAQLEDVQLAVRWVRANAAKYNVDPERIGSMGFSAGGHLVSMLALMETSATETAKYLEYSSRVNSAADGGGPSDLTWDLPTTGPFGMNVQKLVDSLLGVPFGHPEYRARAESASPKYHVDAADSPILIFHGDKDGVVPVEHATQLHETMQKAGAKSELIILRGEGHGLNPQNLKRIRGEAHEFFQKHMAGRPHAKKEPSN